MEIKYLALLVIFVLLMLSINYILLQIKDNKHRPRKVQIIKCPRCKMSISRKCPRCGWEK